MTSDPDPGFDAVDAWCLAQPGATHDTPFGPDTDVYRIHQKIFAITGSERVPHLTLKAMPDDGVALRAQYEAIRPGYHVNKKHWITVDLVGEVPDDEIEELIVESHRIVRESLPKKYRSHYE